MLRTPLSFHRGIVRAIVRSLALGNIVFLMNEKRQKILDILSLRVYPQSSCQYHVKAELKDVLPRCAVYSILIMCTYVVDMCSVG
jgi:hypothetical protein